MRRLMLAAGCALALGGCAHQGDITLTAGKALLISEAAVDGANRTATASYAAGLRGEPAQKVHDAVGTANTAVSAAHSAWLLRNVAEATAQLKRAFDAIALVQETKP